MRRRRKVNIDDDHLGQTLDGLHMMFGKLGERIKAFSRHKFNIPEGSVREKELLKKWRLVIHGFSAYLVCKYTIHYGSAKLFLEEKSLIPDTCQMIQNMVCQEKRSSSFLNEFKYAILLSLTGHHISVIPLDIIPAIIEGNLVHEIIDCVLKVHYIRHYYGLKDKDIHIRYKYLLGIVNTLAKCRDTRIRDEFVSHPRFLEFFDKLCKIGTEFNEDEIVFSTIYELIATSDSGKSKEPNNDVLYTGKVLETVLDKLVYSKTMTKEVHRSVASAVERYFNSSRSTEIFFWYFEKIGLDLTMSDEEKAMAILSPFAIPGSSGVKFVDVGIYQKLKKSRELLYVFRLKGALEMGLSIPPDLQEIRINYSSIISLCFPLAHVSLFDRWLGKIPILTPFIYWIASYVRAESCTTSKIPSILLYALPIITSTFTLVPLHIVGCMCGASSLFTMEKHILQRLLFQY